MEANPAQARAYEDARRGRTPGTPAQASSKALSKQPATKAKAKAAAKGSAAAGTVAAAMGIVGTNGVQSAETSTAAEPQRAHGMTCRLRSTQKNFCSVWARFFKKIAMISSMPALVLDRAATSSTLAPACIAAVEKDTYNISYIMDSGAGRTILSVDSLVQQGVPKSLVNKYADNASTPVVFDTGGGEQPSAKSLGLFGGSLVSQEGYLLEKSPLAVSLGDIVNRHNRAFIWVPNQLPYLVSNPEKLSITCPFKFRQYASHLDQNVPIFTDQVRLGPSSLCLLYTSPSPRDATLSRMPSSA